MFAAILLVDFSWKWVAALLGLSLVAGLVLFLLWMVLMLATLRRSLMGGLIEARVKRFLLKQCWVYAVALGTVGAWMIWGKQIPAGVLVLVGAAILAVFHTPFGEFFGDYGMVVLPLGAHLYSHRNEIEKLQEMTTQASLAEDVAKGSQLLTRQYTPEEEKLREEISRLFMFEQMAFRKRGGVDDLVQEAARSASSRGILGPHGMAAFNEFLFFIIFSLAVSSLGYGFWLASQAGFAWRMPLLYGAAAAVGIRIVVAIVLWARDEFVTLSCLVCRKGTRRWARIGAARTHLCSDACEKKFRHLFGLA